MPWHVTLTGMQSNHPYKVVVEAHLDTPKPKVLEYATTIYTEMRDAGLIDEPFCEPITIEHRG